LLGWKKGGRPGEEAAFPANGLRGDKAHGWDYGRKQDPIPVYGKLDSGNPA